MPEDGIAYLVRYAGLPTPTNGFVDRYRLTHAKVLKEFPGLRGLTLMTPTTWRDTAPVTPDPTDFLAMMRFDDTEALSHALASRARRRAREDFQQFDLTGATVTHQAMRVEKAL